MRLPLNFKVGIGFILWYLYIGVAYVVNLVKFVRCDFEAPYRDEIIHGIGVFAGVPSIVTAWL